jgi:hypothetical protein
MAASKIMVGDGTMADSLTVAGTQLAVGTAGVGLASMFPVDLAAVIGAFGGAFFFILFAKDINNWQRAGYLIVGWIGGYFGSAELLSLAWTRTSGFSSFVAGLVCVVACISIIEAFQTGAWPVWLRAIRARFFGREKPE